MSIIPVLMYHAVESRRFPTSITDEGDRLYVLEVKQFEEQMRYLYKNRFHTVSIDDVQKGKAASPKKVVLTFDDGHASNFTTAFPILKNFSFKAYFFITTDWVNQPGYLTLDQMKALQSAGMIIGSHGMTHKYINDLTADDVKIEMETSRHFLCKATGSEIGVFSAPGGRIKAAHKQIALEAGYEAVFTSQPGYIRNGKCPFFVPRFPMKRYCSLAEFAKILNGDVVYLSKARARKCLTGIFSSLYGNHGYDRLRNHLLAGNWIKSKKSR